MHRRDFVSGLSLAPLAVALSPYLARGRDSAPKILLRSSWQTVNIGDIAHTPGMLTLLEKHFPHAEVRLWPSNIGDGVQEMLNKRFPKLTFAKTPEELRQAFAECDILLHSSGPSLVGAKQVAQWHQETKKPFGVLGITLPAATPQVMELLNKAVCVFFRDSISHQLAVDQGLKQPVVGFMPDSAFAVDLRNDDKALAFLQTNKLEPGKFLCTIPRLRNTPYWEIHNRTMTDADKAKERENLANKEKDHIPMREALIAYVRKTGMKVLVCPEDKSHMAVGREMIMEKLPRDVRDQFVWREQYWLTDEAVSTYVQSFGLLCMDMHSPIMAVGNGIPAIHLRFRQQTSKGQMWKDIGLGEWLFNLDEEVGDGVTKAILGIAADPNAARAKTAKARAFAHSEQAKAVTTFRGLVPKA